MTRLQQLRLDAHLSVAALALRAGVSRQTIYTAERTAAANDTTLFKLADALDARASELLLPAALPDAAA